ncbi:uncharacterized protein LOC135306578 isoform X5 [Passer domesticus]|uniref:uncharacterized protein LOC135306578 isoform X5 n=1 Tax=Passer domesticus TaxID=48849 RepID=UPI0030FE4192
MSFCKRCLSEKNSSDEETEWCWELIFCVDGQTGRNQEGLERNKESKGHFMEFLHPQKPLPWECSHKISSFRSSGQSCMWKVSVQNRILGKNAPLLGLWFACRAAVTAPHFAAWMGCNGVDVHSKTALGISEQTSHTWALSLCRELDFLHDSSFMSESVRPDRQTSFDLGDLSTTILELRTVSPFITLDFGYEE